MPMFCVTAAQNLLFPDCCGMACSVRHVCITDVIMRQAVLAIALRFTLVFPDLCC